MKRKFLLSLLAGFTAVGAVAQQQIKNDMPKGYPVNPAGIEKIKPNTQLSKKGGQIDAWFGYDDYINNNIPSGGNMKQYASFIFPDSNVIFIPDSDSGFYWYQTSVGSIMDPSDPNWGVVSDYFNRRDSYSWDSLAFLYIYRRGTIAANIVDTLYIDCYDKTGLTTRGTFNNSPDVHSRMSYNGTTARGTGFFKTITVLLTTAEETDKSATGWSFKVMTEAVGKALPGLNDSTANMFGFTLNFRPGYTWNLNDTMETSVNSTLNPQNRTSYFGYRQWVNEGDPAGQIANGKYYSHSLIQRKEQTHGGDVNGWTGYLPGNAFFERQYIESFFFLSGSSSLNTVELNQSGSTLGNAYPNPANAGSKLNIDYAVKSATNVTIELYDIFGNNVKTIVNGAVNEGEYTAQVDISDLASGIYFYNMKAGNNFSTSKRVSIIK